MTDIKIATSYTGEVVDAVCELLSRFAAKGKLPAAKENRWGIEVLFNIKTMGVIRFHFVTEDDLEINYDFDMKMLSHQYIADGVLKLMDEIEEARENRQSMSRIEIVTKPSQLALAVKQSIGVIH